MDNANVSAIGKYHIIELIGEGAMGVVYKARDSILDRTVAIKVMSESIAKQDDLRKRFLREAQSAGSLQHPNVVTIHDLGEVDGHLFIAMEFIEGVDLQHLIEVTEPLPLQARLDIIIDVLTGLAFAHKRGIIHRDIKPANIRVGDDGRAKIMDFGVAHLMSSTMTTTGKIMGTPSYMAPEQITRGTSSPATDIFAVGAVLYQLLASMRPFEAPILENLLFKIVTENPRPLSELMPGLPPALDHIVQRAMAKEPSERYANALEMANDLTSVRSKLSGASYPASVALSASVASAIEQSRKKSGRRSRKLAYIGGGALVAASVIAIAWSQFPRSNSAEMDTALAQAAAIAPSPLHIADITAPSPSSKPRSRTASPPPVVVTLPAAPSASEKTSTPATQSPSISTVRPASVCGGDPHCAEVSSFVATVTDFRESLNGGERVVGVTVRFRNRTSGPLTLGYVFGSGVVTDDRGNRYTTGNYGGNVRGLGVIAPGGQIDPKFSLRPGESADARFEFTWSPGRALFGTRFVVELAVREIQAVGGDQWRLGQEHALHFRGFGDPGVADAR